MGSIIKVDHLSYVYNPGMPNAVTALDDVSFEVEEGDFVAMVEFDELDYRKRHENQAVKKTLTIPGWLNHLAEEQGLNFSRVLQNALKRELNVQ